MILPPPEHQAKTRARAKTKAKAKARAKGKPKPPAPSMVPDKPQPHPHALIPEKQLVSAMELLHEIVQTSGQQILVDPDARPSTKTIHRFFECVCNYLGEISEPILGSQRVFILDGTTITLPPTPALRAAYPPAPNQYGESVWPVAMLMLANEMASGCALLPQVDPMYGEHHASEAEQARRIVKQLPAHSIVMADSGFAIYSVAYHSTQSQHEFLFRLTSSRFRPLRRQAELMDEGPTHKTYHLDWQPSAKDRKTNPDLPAEASIEVLLHEVEISPQLTLYLISNQRSRAFRRPAVTGGVTMWSSIFGISRRLAEEASPAQVTEELSPESPSPAFQVHQVREKNQLPQRENPLQWSQSKWYWARARRFSVCPCVCPTVPESHLWWNPRREGECSRDKTPVYATPFAGISGTLGYRQVEQPFGNSPFVFSPALYNGADRRSRYRRTAAFSSERGPVAWQQDLESSVAA